MKITKVIYKKDLKNELEIPKVFNSLHAFITFIRFKNNSVINNEKVNLLIDDITKKAYHIANEINIINRINFYDYNDLHIFVNDWLSEEQAKNKNNRRYLSFYFIANDKKIILCYREV